MHDCSCRTRGRQDLVLRNHGLVVESSLCVGRSQAPRALAMCGPPACLDRASVSLSCRAGLPVACPTCLSFLTRLGWSFSSDSSCLYCRDAEGHARTIRVGYELFSGVRQWLVAHYRRLFLAQLDRLWCPVIRPADYAVGRQLPPPDADAVFSFEGHKRAFREASHDRHISLACVAARASSWHFNAGGDFSHDHPRQVCLCNKRLPSRPHLAWNCPCLPVDRDLQLPTDRAGERLFALPGGSQPFAPPAIDRSLPMPLSLT